METIHLEYRDMSPEVAQIFESAYPGHKTKARKIVISDSVNCASSWDGGSRSTFCFVNLATLARSNKVPNQSAFDPKIGGVQEVHLPKGFVCVEHSIFCGKDTGLTIHTPPGNVNKLALPAPKAKLSREEMIVLTATASLKSSYGGVRDYRKHEAMQTTKISAEAFDVARVHLIDSGLLRKNKSITSEGRNIVGTKELYHYRAA